MQRFFLYALLFFVMACNDAPQEQAAEPEGLSNEIALSVQQQQAAGIETAPIRSRTISSELLVNGLVDVPPQNIVSVSFPLGGYLKTTALLPGMHINRGEVIAIMEDPALIQLQQDFLMAKARLQYLQLDFERQQLLHTNQVNSDKVFQQASADFNAQKVLVKGYSEKLKLIGINPETLTDEKISRSVPVHSPINGFVSKVNVNIGKYVNPSDVLFELINPEDIHAALTVFEKDISLVKPRQKVWVTFVDDPGTAYECEVLLVTRNVDDNRSALVHCHFEQQPRQLLPGMFLNAKIETGNQVVTAVPEAALVRYGNQEFLIENATDSLFRLLPVTTGVRAAGWVAVTHNTDSLEGRKIVIKNPYPVLGKIKNRTEEE